MISVLFVCLGNICRSPLAEGIFSYLVQQHRLENRIKIDSAGTGAWHVGEFADPRSQEVAEAHGILLTSKARKLEKSDFNDFDYIIAMDQSNLKNIRILGAFVAPYKAQVKLMREFENHTKSVKDVQDPYYGGIEGFEKTFQILNQCNQNLLNFICRTHHL